VTTTLASHPAAAIFPMMTEAEIAALAEDIRINGQHEPIVTLDDQILDGRNRWKACELAGVEPKTVKWDGSGNSPTRYVLSLNVRRRQLTPSQLATVGRVILPLLEAEAKERQRQGREKIPYPGRTGKASEHAAALVGVNPRYISDANKLAEKAPELFEQVSRGELTLPEAMKPVRAEERRQREEAAHRDLVLAPDHPVRLEVADSAQHIPLEDESIDLIVTSPPYAVGLNYEGGDIDPETWPDFMARWLFEAYRVSRDGGRLALNVPLDTSKPVKRPTYAQAVELALEAGWTYAWTAIWDEDNVSKSTGRGSVDSPSTPHVVARVEHIAVFTKGEWGRSSEATPDLRHAEWLDWTNGLWRFPGESKAWEGYRGAFPEELARRFITLLSFPDDVVLDPFCGSGTTPLVAHRLKRQAIGFDISPKAIESSKRRLAAESEAEVAA
jgi:site-specific DNA-methyltransferase (adenine-specific)